MLEEHSGLRAGGGETRRQHEGEEEDAKHQRRLRESPTAHTNTAL